MANLVSLFMQINQTGKRIFWKKSFEFQITNMCLSTVLFSFQLPVTEKTCHLLWLSRWITLPSQLTHHSFNTPVPQPPPEMVWDVRVLFAASLLEIINPSELEKGNTCPMANTNPGVSAQSMFTGSSSQNPGPSVELTQNWHECLKLLEGQLAPAKGQISDFHRHYLNSLSKVNQNLLLKTST